MLNEYKISNSSNYHSSATNYYLPEKTTEINLNFISTYSNNIFGNDLNINKHPKKLGNLFAYFYYKNYPLILINFNQMFLFLTYQILINFFFILSILFYFKYIYSFLKFLNIFSFLIPFFSHLIIFFINPGTPNLNSNFFNLNEFENKNKNKNNENEKKNFLYCKICNIFVKEEENVVHCDECNLCVKYYDHHCYWTSKCITDKNIFFFYLFIFGTIVFIIVFSMSVIYAFYVVINKKNKKL